MLSFLSYDQIYLFPALKSFLQLQKQDVPGWLTSMAEDVGSGCNTSAGQQLQALTRDVLSLKVVEAVKELQVITSTQLEQV